MRSGYRCSEPLLTLTNRFNSPVLAARNEKVVGSIPTGGSRSSPASSPSADSARAARRSVVSLAGRVASCPPVAPRPHPAVPDPLDGHPRLATRRAYYDQLPLPGKDHTTPRCDSSRTDSSASSKAASRRTRTTTNTPPGPPSTKRSLGAMGPLFADASVSFCLVRHAETLDSARRSQRSGGRWCVWPSRAGFAALGSQARSACRLRNVAVVRACHDSTSTSRRSLSSRPEAWPSRPCASSPSRPRTSWHPTLRTRRPAVRRPPRTAAPCSPPLTGRESACARAQPGRRSAPHHPRSRAVTMRFARHRPRWSLWDPKPARTEPP